MIVAILIFVAAVVVAVCFFLIRANSEEHRLAYTDDERRTRIVWYALLGVLAPWPACYLLLKMVDASRPTLDKIAEPSRTPWLLLLGSVCTAAGLPFVVKMLRLIRSDGTAGFATLLMSGYGLVLWTVVNAVLLLTFMKSCC